MASLYHIAPRELEAPDLKPGPVRRAVKLWLAWLDRLVPLGYEDELGFHFGSPAPVPAVTPPWC